jgi:hypothetical protein
VGEVGEGEGQVQFQAVFAAGQWRQPNMSSRAYRRGGVLVPSEAEVISQYYAWYRTRMGITATGRSPGGDPAPPHAAG